MWPDLEYRDPTPSEVEEGLDRADYFADAHVEGEHEANRICRWTDAWTCGLKNSAATYVETTDMRR